MLFLGFITVESQTVDRATIAKVKFSQKGHSKYIDIKIPLHKQSWRVLQNEMCYCLFYVKKQTEFSGFFEATKSRKKEHLPSQ